MFTYQEKYVEACQQKGTSNRDKLCRFVMVKELDNDINVICRPLESQWPCFNYMKFRQN